MNPTFKLPKLTLIEWVDSTSPGGPSIWVDHATVEAISEPSVCYTVGFVVKETGTAITLAGSYSANQLSGSMCIPKAAILRRLKVKV